MGMITAFIIALLVIAAFYAVVKIYQNKETPRDREIRANKQRDEHPLRH